MAKLVVEVVSARDPMPSDGHHGSASPFVEVSFDKCSLRTRTNTRDLCPTWNEKLVFDIKNPRNLHESMIQVIVYDERCTNDEFLGCVQISGASVSLLESDATLQRHPLCKTGFFAHGRGDISLRIYTIRAQCYVNPQLQRSRLDIITRKHKKEEEEEEVLVSANSGSSVHISPTLYFLRICVIEARNLEPYYKNQAPDFRVQIQHKSQILVTRTSKILVDDPLWNEDLLFVTSEPFDDYIFISVVDGGTGVKQELIGKTVLPVNGITQRFDSTYQVEEARWFNLNDSKTKKQGKILLRLCLDAGYNVCYGKYTDFQPSSNHMKKDSIGSLILTILGAKRLLPMKRVNSTQCTTDAYCVVKYGNKWIRTRTVVKTLDPCWNEYCTFQVYDPCTEITIGVFDDENFNGSKKETRDGRIGKIVIPVQCLEMNQMHTHNYPLLRLVPCGLKKFGELKVSVRFTSSLTWANIFSIYKNPLLPKMHYLQPLGVRQLDFLRFKAMDIVTECLSKAEPSIKKKTVEYMLDWDLNMWSLRKHKAHFERVMSFVLGITAVCRWFNEIRHWRNPLKTIFIHFLYSVFVWYPKLLLPTFFISLTVTGMCNYKSRPRNPPQHDAHLSLAKTTCLDDLDEEFDTFPTSRSFNKVKRRYDLLRSIAGRYQTVAGDIATQGEKAMAILTCTDLKATLIFTAFAFVCVVFVYIASFKVAATLFGLYILRHPWLRSNKPSLLVNLFNRLPSKMDIMLLLTLVTYCVLLFIVILALDKKRLFQKTCYTFPLAQCISGSTNFNQILFLC